MIVCIQQPSHHFLQLFRALRLFKIVFHDISLHPTNLFLFCLLWLISACANRIGYITNFSSMKVLLLELTSISC